MASITLQWDRKELEALKGHRVERALVRALSMSGGDAIRAMRADSKRRIRERKRVQARYLADKALPLTFPRRGAPLEGLVWTMGVSGKGVPLSKYSARQTKKGVTVEVNRGKRTLVKSAFIAKLKSGRTGVFVRQGKARMPIDHSLSSRPVDVMKDRGVVPAVQTRAQSVFIAAMWRLLPLELAKLK